MSTTDRNFTNNNGVYIVPEKVSKTARNQNLFVLFIAFSTEKGSKTTVKIMSTDTVKSHRSIILNLERRDKLSHRKGHRHMGTR